MQNIVNTAALVLTFAYTSSCYGIFISNGSPTYTQDFDTLANTGMSSAVPADWGFSESDVNANGMYNTGTGSNNAGDTYSFGAAASTERAFGTLQSGNLLSTIGASFSNGGTTNIESLAIAYQGEQWRLGTNDRSDRLDFQYSLDASSLVTGTWFDVNTLDFSSPNTTDSDGAKDGNAVGYRSSISSSITSLAIAPSAGFWIRWLDFDATSADDGLAVDDFSITATFAVAVPEPGAFLFGGSVCGVLGVVAAARRMIGRFHVRQIE